MTGPTPDGPLRLRPTAPCLRCAHTLSRWDLSLGLRCDACFDGELRRLLTPPAQPVQPRPCFARGLLVGLALSVAFWTALWAGQTVMCDAWDGALRYCAGGEQ